MQALIASPHVDCFLLVRPGHRNGARIPERNYEELVGAAAEGHGPPGWLLDTATRAWPDLDIAGQPVTRTILIRPRTPWGFARASYELNLGCNYDCPVCYLGVKKFSGLTWEDRVRLLHIMRDAGVLWSYVRQGGVLTGPADGRGADV